MRYRECGEKGERGERGERDERSERGERGWGGTMHQHEGSIGKRFLFSNRTYSLLLGSPDSCRLGPIISVLGTSLESTCATRC